MNQMKRYYIIRSMAEALPFKEESDAVMQREDFREYVNSHGFHFTCKLADYVNKHMTNADGTDHHWTTAQVKEAMAKNNMELKEGMTDGDIAYLANMAYADFYPKVIETEAGCLKYAHAMNHDPDGYPEVAFMRWVSDLIGKSETIEWEQFIY